MGSKPKTSIFSPERRGKIKYFFIDRPLGFLRRISLKIQRYLFPDKFGFFPGIFRYKLACAIDGTSWNKLPSAILLESFSTGNWGGNDLFVADINGDGKTEFLWLQSPGVFKADVYRQRPVFSHLKNEDPNLFCLTVTDVKGRILWQTGNPQTGWLYCSHAAERSICCYDVDGDGNLEVLALGSQSELLLLDGKNGKIKNKTTLPADNFAIVACGRFGPSPTDVRILVSNSTVGYAPHSYGNPTLFLDSSLQIVHTADFLGSGHCPVVFDADDDGYDEVLLGYELIDLHGRKIWTLDRWRTESFSTDQHVDEAKLFSRDCKWNIAITGGDRLYVIDAGGNTLWYSPQPHAQYVVVGKFVSKSNEDHLFVTNSLNDYDKTVCFSTTGEKIWEKKLPEHWPMGRPRCIERTPYFHKGISAVCWKNPVAGKPDVVIYCEKGWPYGVGEDGTPSIVFPQMPAIRKPERQIPPPRPDDYGFSYSANVADVDGDGIDEIVIYDRTNVWVYRMP